MTLLYAFNFDEASGNILDQSGNGRNVALGGALARTASGAGHTDKGMSQSTTASDSNGPSLTGLQTAQFTVMAWVKRSTNSLDGWIAEIKASGSGDRGILFLSGNVQARARNSGGTVANVSTAQPTAGTWYHVAASYSTTDAKVHLFINGSEIGTGTALTGPLKTTSTGSHLIDSLGSETVIDDVRYYDTALTAAEITTLMSTPVSGGVSWTAGTATETGTAHAMTWTKIPALGVPTETDTAQPVSLSKTPALGTATEADTADEMQLSKFEALQPSGESGTAHPMTWSSAPALGAADETDVAHPLAWLKTSGLDMAGETGTPHPMAWSTASSLGTATETDTPHPMTWSKSVVFGTADELDAARRMLFPTGGPYVPVTDPLAELRPNPATARPRSNPATTGLRPNPAKASI
jgi:hypothetical protein